MKQYQRIIYRKKSWLCYNYIKRTQNALNITIIEAVLYVNDSENNNNYNYCYNDSENRKSQTSRTVNICMENGGKVLSKKRINKAGCCVIS